MSKTTLTYGSWPSELSAETLASAGHRFGHIQVDQGRLYWLQSIPEQGGRQVIYCYQQGTEVSNIIPDDYSVRTRVHEYGGGDFAVRDGVVVFCNDSDQRLYLLQGNEPPKAISPEPEFKHATRFADMHIHTSGDWLVAVRERHNENHDPAAVVNDLVRISLSGDCTVTELTAGADFYAYPRFSPDGRHLAWISWVHPNMPWDDTCLSQASISSEGTISDLQLIMDNGDESIYQPSWCPDGELHFVSDRNNWWNIYSLRDDVLNALTPMRVEFGFPQWQFGVRSYQFLDDNHLAAIYSQDGMEHLALVELDSGQIKSLDLDFCHFEGGLQHWQGKLYFIAATKYQSAAVYEYHIENKKLLCISGDKPSASEQNCSVAEGIWFDTADKQQAHAFYYAPLSSDYEGNAECMPPLIVMGHGGPTGATSAAYSDAIQFWTQRGFAVVDVNYRGSTGFGRAYRDSLKYQWGIADVEDCIAVAKHLIAKGKANPDCIAIRGGSAGGLTVYRALQTSDVFKAGMSRYGVADLVSLAKDTHKFELRYLDRLIGELPKDRDVYLQRSPLTQADKLSVPMLLLQGDQDAVVPAAQSISMAEALDKKNVPHHLEILAGEQHGFRISENIIKALELELNFYRQVFAIKADEKLSELKLKHSERLNK